MFQALTRRGRGTSDIFLSSYAMESIRNLSTGLSNSVNNLLKDKELGRHQLYINGEWTSGKASSTFDVVNPATGRAVAQLPSAGSEDTRAAIEAAHQAFPAWSNRTAKNRAAILRKWYEEIVKHKDDIATLMTLECGKPLAEARNEIDSGAASVEWFAEEAKRVCGDIFEPSGRDRQMVLMKQPVGPVGAITPWNFPMSMITRKVSPAIAAGCTVVLKPSEETPLTALALLELANRAGVPPGVFNMVFGDAKTIGEEITKSELIRKIGFTGSTPVGKLLMAQASSTVKKVSLELGGNAPLIVFDDADLDLAVRGAVGSRFRNAGQTCICANRIYVQEGIYDAFLEAFSKRVKSIRAGNGLEPGVTLGPLINRRQLDRVIALVDRSVAMGAKPLVGGKPLKLAGDEAGGFFFEPSILTDVDDSMPCVQEEIFGPVASVLPFKTEEEVVRAANDTPYGLAAYFYTKDLARTWRVAAALEYGMVGVNEVAIGSEVAPFGGVKQSGLGREQSKYGLDEFLESKYVCMGLGYAN